MSVILNFRGLCCVGSIFYYYYFFFFSSGVIKCWGDLKRSLHWGGKTAITALMQWSRRPSSPSFGPVTVYIKSEIMCCVGAKVMRPLGSNQGWHSPTYSYSNSTASTFTQCHTRVRRRAEGAKNNNVKRKGTDTEQRNYANTWELQLCNERSD